MTDYKQLCAELIEIWDNTSDFDYNDFGNAAKDLVIRARAALAQPEPDVAGELTDQELLRCANIATPCYDLKGWERELRMMRAAITADCARRPAPAPAGERQSTPVPVASDVYFEFVVSDADYCTQAGGIAPSYAQALSEGQHYLAQYQQDGPHTLEVRRVENLNPGAFPVPDDAPLSLLPEDAQALLAQTEPPPPVAGEVAELVAWLRNMSEAGLGGLDELNAGCAADLLERQYPQPVRVSERPPGPEDCDAEGRCWLCRKYQSDGPTWRLTRPASISDEALRIYYAYWLPAHALPIPTTEPQP